jgi:hypothetical protein
LPRHPRPRASATVPHRAHPTQRRLPYSETRRRRDSPAPASIVQAGIDGPGRSRTATRRLRNRPPDAVGGQRDGTETKPSYRPRPGSAVRLAQRKVAKAADL